jgi:hypothetical protein
MRTRPSPSFRYEKFLLTNNFAFLFYLVLPYLFFGPGKNLSSVILGHGDGWVDGLPFSLFSRHLSMWNPYILSGTFAFKDIGFQSLYPLGILVTRLLPNVLGFNILILIHYTAAGLFTFLFLRQVGLRRIASYTGGLIFMFSGFLVAHQGHPAMFMSACYMPVVLYFIERYIVSRKASSLFGATFAFALSILADYTAVPMYIGMITFPYIVFRVLAGKEFIQKSLRAKLATIISASFVIFVMGLLLSALQIVPILESLPYITREKISYEFFSSYSFPIKLLPIVIFPYIFGAQSLAFYRPGYFGPWNLTEMSGYVGILPLLFAVFAVVLFAGKNKQIRFWAAVALIAFILVLGDSTPFYKLMYRVPIYNMFRASARNWLEVNFAISILSAFFIQFVSIDTELQRFRYINLVHVGIGGIILSAFFILLFGDNLQSTVQAQALWRESSQLVSPAIYVPLLNILVSAIVVYGLYQYRSSTEFLALVSVIIFIDLFSFGHFYNPVPPPYKILEHESNPVADFLSAEELDKHQYRILGLNAEDHDNQIYPDVNMMYGFQTVNGYSNIWLKTYRNLTKFEGNGYSTMKYQMLQNSAILSSLSTKYIITSQDEDKQFLQKLRMDVAPVTPGILIDGFSNDSWQFISPAKLKKTSITLQSKSGQVSLVQIPIELQPSSFYTVEFWARMPRQPASDPLIVDIFGENYDTPEQEARFSGAEDQDFHTRDVVSRGYQEYSAKFYTGEHIPKDPSLRFFTLSNEPYEIKDVKLIPDNGEVQSFNDSDPSTPNPSPLYVKKFESGTGIAVYENLNFLPRARFVTMVTPVEGAAATDILWNDANFNPSQTALVEDFTGNTKLDEATVLKADYSDNNKVLLSVETGRRAFLILSDAWYPGWKAYIDGQETLIYKTNAVSRGILITGEGKHQVEFRFVPMSFYLGLGLTCLTMLGMGVFLSISKRFRSLNRREIVQ